MAAFLALSATLTIIALLFLVVPLRIKPPYLRTACLVSVLMPIAASPLYARWSNWHWDGVHPVIQDAASGPVSERANTMLEELERKAAMQPGNSEAQLSLGQAYLVKGMLQSAATVLAKANRAGGGNDVEVLLSLGEALALQAGGRVPPEADGLFERAIALAPEHPQALLLSGLAAAQRGDATAARRRWEKLKAQGPPARVLTLLNARLAALEDPAAAAR